MENSSLQMASMVQKRADQEVLKLIEDQKVSLCHFFPFFLEMSEPVYVGTCPRYLRYG